MLWFSCSQELGGGRDGKGERRQDPRRPSPHHPPYPYLGAVEITQVCVGVPAWPTGTLIDVHALKVYVHLHLPPRAVNWQLGVQQRVPKWSCVLRPQTREHCKLCKL